MKIFTYVDKSKYKYRGEWDSEPDKLEWKDKETGLPCLIVRGPSGSLCGYVGVNPSHPFHGKDYDNVDVEVHGGLTYAAACQKVVDGHGICHTPEPGEEENVWWFGFDTAHLYDLSPAFQSFSPGDVYRPISYVRAEVESLARQLVAQK